VIYNNQDLKTQLQKYLDFNSKNLEKTLTLEIIQIGNDLASSTYIEKKQDLGKKIGFEVILHKFENPNSKNIQKILTDLNQTKNGLIFQLPIPDEFTFFVDQTPAFADVDLLGFEKTKLLKKGLLPPTIASIDLVLKDILNNQKVLDLDILMQKKLDLSGKMIGVVGQGRLVGEPMVEYLLKTGATIISLNKETADKQGLTKMCDILITGAGSPNLINENWLKKGAIIVDAATSESDGQLVGDISQNIDDKNFMLVKSPGGIGPLTVLFLFYNLICLKSLDF
jgi:methylenetetrahydrofolate dehydrogenase (NADP+)/methenyltetrahydrofolate cyclohydrolase